MGRTAFLFFLGLVINRTEGLAQQGVAPVFNQAKPAVSLKVLPQNFYTQHLSFTCKKEVQLQKLTSLPVYIRLGSKDYVDYLEKKPNAGWQPKP